MTATILPQGAGYGVVVGIGLFFSALMITLTAIQTRYTTFSLKSPDEYTSASRSVKPGLIASGIVSAWTWAATLLQSCAVGYKFGISGPWWYGAGATVQILLFAMLAAKLKMNAPYAHTWLEIVGMRWGRAAHLIFMFFGLATNITVSSMLILGGSATVTDLTGMSTVAACFLIPLGVAIYVAVGGMRSTLLCDYTHTSVLFAIILTFIFTVYSLSEKIGSVDKMYELLQKAAIEAPVSGNAQGSYTTMRSTNGLVFGIINIVGNFATVFQDQAYWQRAIASRPASTVRAYLLGGLAWFSIPFTFATTLGLAAVALRGDPDMRVLTPADVSAGLPAAAAAAALLGKAGAAALLVLLFLAVTSASSAELIAVSTILTYDVYKAYINPKATDAQILRVSHAMVAFYALVSGIAGVIFFYIGISMGWLYTFMGVILGSGVAPIALCITWKKANRLGCLSGTVVGFVAGIVAWLVTTAKLNDGVINVETSGGDFEMLAGNVTSIVVGGLFAVVTSLVWPDDFDWESTRAINKPVNIDTPSLTQTDTRAGSPEHIPLDVKRTTWTGEDTQESVRTHTRIQAFTQQEELRELNPVTLQAAFKFASWSSLTLFVLLIILIPLPLFFSGLVFSPSGMLAWVIMGVAWTICSAVIVVIYPVYESRDAMAQICRGVVHDICRVFKRARWPDPRRATRVPA